VSPLGALEASAFSQSLRGASPLFMAVKAAHLAGIFTLLASIVMLDLRLLGLRRSIPVRRLAARLLPWSAGSFLLIVPSGLVMFMAHPSALIADPVFALKFCLILAAAANAGVLHMGAFRGAGSWDVGVMPPAAVRIAAALSLLLWFSVAACGRWLAAATASL
jgi:hypothetical protein